MNYHELLLPNIEYAMNKHRRLIYALKILSIDVASCRPPSILPYSPHHPNRI